LVVADDLHDDDDALFASSTANARDSGVALLDLWARTDWMVAEGYLRGARMVVDAACAVPAGPEVDQLTFPALFLYRHALELKLKELIETAFRWKADQPPNLWGHDLAALWQKIPPWVSRVSTEAQRTECAQVIKQLQAADTAQAEAFRYTLAGRGQDALQLDRPLVELNRVAVRIESAFRSLDGWVTGFDVAIENASEASADAPDADS
jgi:hypothetical protein